MICSVPDMIRFERANRFQIFHRDDQNFMHASSMLDRSCLPRETERASAARNDWRVLKRAINITDLSIMHAHYQYMKREMRAYVST